MGYFDNLKTDELEHHGVLGMKWGVRRYQNYDGSLTRAGVKRYSASKEAYEKADERYKAAKVSYKSASDKKNGTEKTELVNAKLARKKANQKLVKDYKHLKQDKLADQGKNLYASGKTITGNSNITSTLAKVGSISLSALVAKKKYGINLDNKYVSDSVINKTLLAVGATSLAAAGIKGAIDYHQDKRLRAYYSHTSNY